MLFKTKLKEFLPVMQSALRLHSFANLYADGRTGLLSELCCTSVLLLKVMELCVYFANSLLKLYVLKLSFD